MGITTSIALCEPIGASMTTSTLFKRKVDVYKISCIALTIALTAMTLLSG